MKEILQKIRSSRRIQTSLVVVLVSVVVLSVVLIHLYQDGAKRQRQAESPKVVVDGVTYYQKTDMINILVLGIDLRGRIENEKHVLGENGQSDMMCVISIDEKTGGVTLLTIPRETMANIDVSASQHNMTGKKTTEEKQICLQYAYASSSQMGAELASQCVEDLLDIPIDYYVAISMGGIETLVDDIGGVDITMSGDYLVPTYLGHPDTPEWLTYHAGETVHMTGAESYEFVHFRDTSRNATNLERMDRQKDFFKAFVHNAKATLKTDLTQITTIAQDLDGYMTTNIATADYVKLAKYGLKAKLDENSILRIPGQDIHVEPYDEYHVDEDALLQMELGTFYETE